MDKYFVFLVCWCFLKLVSCMENDQQFYYRKIDLEMLSCYKSQTLLLGTEPIILQMGHLPNVSMRTNQCAVNIIAKEENRQMFVVVHSMNFSTSSKDHIRFYHIPSSKIVRTFFNVFTLLRSESKHLKYNYKLDLDDPYFIYLGDYQNVFRSDYGVKIEYKGGKSRHNEFSIVITPYTIRDSECLSHEFMCTVQGRRRYCVDGRLKCDGRVNCLVAPAVDESYCSVPEQGSSSMDRALSWLMLVLAILLIVLFLVSSRTRLARSCCRRRRPSPSAPSRSPGRHWPAPSVSLAMPLRALGAGSNRDLIAGPVVSTRGASSSSSKSLSPPSYEKVQNDDMASLPAYKDLFPSAPSGSMSLSQHERSTSPGRH